MKMKNQTLDYVRSKAFKNSKGKLFAWPILILFILFDWEAENEDE